MDDRNNPAGSNLAATLMLDSVARSRSRHLSRSTLAKGPLMFEVDEAANPPTEAAAKATVEWARQLAASAARLRREVRGR